jgi:MFS family permease
VYGATGGGITALAPMVAKDILHGDAATYGVILGAIGIGAVAGALLTRRLLHYLSAENVLRLCAAASGLAIAGVGMSHNVLLTAALCIVVGVVNMVNINILNVSIQLSVPRWVMARSLAWFSSAIAAGIGLGAWFWGEAAGIWGVAEGLMASGVAVFLSMLVGFVLPVKNLAQAELQMADLGGDPEVALGITNRSGPVVIEVDYDVDPEQARQFYNVMVEMQRVRRRNGAFDWSLSRDLADPSGWTERYHFPTWGEDALFRPRQSWRACAPQIGAAFRFRALAIGDAGFATR